MAQSPLLPALAGATGALLLLVVVTSSRRAGVQESPPPGAPGPPDLDALAKEQARLREINRKRGEDAETDWKKKPLGFEKEAKAVAESYPLVKVALDAIFSGIRAVVTMPHIEAVNDPVWDLVHALPQDQQESLQIAALRVPFPFSPGESNTVFSRQEYANLALYQEARARGIIPESIVDKDVVQEVQGLLRMADQAVRTPFSPPLFAQKDPQMAALQPQLAAAWLTGYDGQSEALDLVDRQGGANTQPNPDLGRTRLVLAIAQREGQLARKAGTLREGNPFAAQP